MDTDDTEGTDGAQGVHATHGAEGTHGTDYAHDTDVIVVGAGPTGLMLAGELRLGGARVTVVERLAAPAGQSRGLGFTARAMEVFDQRGLLPRFGRGPVPPISPVGHFGGVRFDYTVLEGAHFGARDIPQSETEAVLEEWATERGARVRRGRELTGLTADDTGVEAVLRTPAGTERLRGAYLVGCDGGHSTVRDLAGFGFPGTPATRVMYLADVAGRAVRPRPLGERLPNGMVMAAPLGDGVDRIIVCPHGSPPDARTGPVGFPEVAAAWRHITGEDISDGHAPWVSSFTDATRQADRYRRGRVLLAGDAAHIHLPAGGQGLSTGVQDAVNLGWKLAAVARGTAPESLLDTYDDERRPVGARLLMNTRAQGLIFLGGAEADPLRDLFTELLEHDDVKRHLAGVVSGLDVRYPAGPGHHPLLGRRVGHRELAGGTGGTSTTELLHPARGVLLDLADEPAVRTAATGFSDRVTVATAVPEPVDGTDPLTGTAALLVRPDGHVAWAAPGTGDPSAGLEDALRAWFGPPRAPADNSPTSPASPTKEA